MNGGIHDAWNLSDKICGIVKDNYPLSRLSLYSRQRQKIAQDEILKNTDKNRSRMQNRDKKSRAKELIRLQNIASTPDEARKFLLRSSMIEGLKKTEQIT